MDRSIFLTEDGSHSLKLKDWDESFHSKFGAITESKHVFIKNGLAQCTKPSVSIFEMGFGTGLNTLLSLAKSQDQKQHISYTTVEQFPLTPAEYNTLNYASELMFSHSTFLSLHSCPWDIRTRITDQFSLLKHRGNFLEMTHQEAYDLVYFDAFGPEVQPELWTLTALTLIANNMKAGGIFVTYCAKGVVRRTLERLGYKTERLPGPPGKREMLRATKENLEP